MVFEAPACLNGQEHGKPQYHSESLAVQHYITIRDCIGIMEKKIETIIRGYIRIMEKKMETTIIATLLPCWQTSASFEAEHDS